MKVPLRLASLQASPGVVGAAVAAALSLFVVLVWASGSPPDLDERIFLATAYSLRTSLAGFYEQTARQGEGHCPTSLAQLGPDAVPLDPWTGRRDWVALRNERGEIVGVYSRSAHRIRNLARLARYASPRPGLTPSQAAVLGISAWGFYWNPSAESVPRNRTPLSAVAALYGQWPGEHDADTGLPMPPRIPRRLHTVSCMGVASAQAGRPPAPNACAAAAPPPSLDPPAIDPMESVRQLAAMVAARLARFVTVPIAAIPDDGSGSGEAPSGGSGAGGRSSWVAMASSSSGSVATTNVAITEEALAAADAPPPEEERVLSEDPATRRCQVAMAWQNPAEVCRLVKGQDDNGLAYDFCLRDLEHRVADCATSQ